MSPPDDPATRLIEADRAATLARQRLSETLGKLQLRLAPRRLADDAVREARLVGTASADAAVRHPGVVAGTIAAIGLLLARRPLARLIRRKPGETAAETPR